MKVNVISGRSWLNSKSSLYNYLQGNSNFKGKYYIAKNINQSTYFRVLQASAALLPNALHHQIPKIVNIHMITYTDPFESKLNDD